MKLRNKMIRESVEMDINEKISEMLVAWIQQCMKLPLYSEANVEFAMDGGKIESYKNVLVPEHLPSMRLVKPIDVTGCDLQSMDCVDITTDVPKQYYEDVMVPFFEGDGFYVIVNWEVKPMYKKEKRYNFHWQFAVDIWENEMTASVREFYIVPNDDDLTMEKLV